MEKDIKKSKICNANGHKKSLLAYERQGLQSSALNVSTSPKNLQ
jgi:hypothetical protein